MRIGLDVGSTTIKCVVMGDDSPLPLHTSYDRHGSQIREKTADILRGLCEKFSLDGPACLTISGSAGMGLAQACGVPFVQEVYATKVAADTFLDEVDVIIELGGEDAKILFLEGIMETRMNGSCAGGTGAFIDQMASLLDLSLEEMDHLAGEHDKIYTIASRCGVFAKSDIQPLLNQGANKKDISASIFSSVVHQTIAGLAQGRKIGGNVVYLGGPLTFLASLRDAFDRELATKGVYPEHSLYYVAMGAALCAREHVELFRVIDKIEAYQGVGNFALQKPLFKNDDEVRQFRERHAIHTVPETSLSEYRGKVYLGIDAGSTTVKLALIGEDEELLFKRYVENKGNPIPIIRGLLEEMYDENPDIRVAGSAVTGYGEEMIRNAFLVDTGLVETMAHFTAARKFLPEVDFVIDIGGQDIKCFQIHQGVVDNLFLNEACSSGCGSFLQTFASSLGYTVEEFSKLGLLAQHPVDLGSRCTVFMNSSVKQAQKEGATIGDISAGLSMSVVKNALYKVIRIHSTEDLGKNVVVQGGTFLNEAVLRTFEREIGREVIRPSIAGLMGAYGTALYAKANVKVKSTLLSREELAQFQHKTTTTNCGLCVNHCRLTVNSFGNGRTFLGGNRCQRPVLGNRGNPELNLYQFKRSLLDTYRNVEGSRGVIGIPMGLNMLELLPFWSSFFRALGFSMITSPPSDRSLYLRGHNTIPSDTVCYPAKLMHGHVQSLLESPVDMVFYPCMSYNFDEGLGDNHYNCPVVAYYPEVVGANQQHEKTPPILKDYIGLHRKRDFPGNIHRILKQYFPDLLLSEVRNAARVAYHAYDQYLTSVRKQGEEIIRRARKEHRRIFVLAGRPYHIDPEINHGIDQLLISYGAAVISEDAVAVRGQRQAVSVLNQWTYHARLYSAAAVVSENRDMNFIQLVSFGCGLDAITSDEVRDILELKGRIYTQIKIDEITNLGAVKIRIRSLIAALEEQEGARYENESHR